MPPISGRLTLLLFGAEPRMQLVLKRTAPASAVYLCCILAQWAGVVLGLVEVQPALVQMVVMAVGAVAFYPAVRSGWSRRLRDPTLTLPQMVYAIVSLALAYQNDWPLRAILPMMAALVLVFGAFALRPLACRQLGWLAVAMFALSMVTGAWRDPARFPPLIEMFHFVFVATVLPVVALLAGQLSQVRSDLRRQKGELREALARLSEIATRDELTGLPNRRHMQDWIAHEFARSHRHGAALCLAVIDLDHFKRVNDLHGHAVGDEGLRIFAREARKSLRDVDLIARWGGEEFLLAMPDTTEAGAARVLERLRQRLADPQAWAACPQARVTFSAGLATHGSAESVEDTVRRADDALYAAKRQGRDRVVSG